MLLKLISVDYYGNPVKSGMKPPRCHHTKRVFAGNLCQRTSGVFFLTDFVNFPGQRSICFPVVNSVFKP